MTDFSVVICTYNGAQKLPWVLDKLKLQEQVLEINWEVLVVNNNSTDETAAVICQYQQSWLPGVPLRSCFEAEQGLAYARRCAIQHVQAPLVGFLDDDNLPGTTWVYEAWRFGTLHPQAGAYGSEVCPIYDVLPPSGFGRIAPLLAIIERGDQPFIYSQRRGVLPAGAGMVVRRQAWLTHVPERPWLAGVTARSLRTKGEDVETLSYIRDGGWDVWHNPAMKIQHHIPAERIQRAYLLRLCCSVGLNRFPLRMGRYQPWLRPFVLPLYMGNDLKRLIVYLLRNYRWLPDDVVCACEVALLGSSLISPFYHWYSQFMAWVQYRPMTLMAQGQSSGR